MVALLAYDDPSALIRAIREDGRGFGWPNRNVTHFNHEIRKALGLTERDPMNVRREARTTTACSWVDWATYYGCA